MATKSKSKKTEVDLAKEKSASDHARDLSAARRPASTDLAANVAKGEWPVPPGTKNPPNEKFDGKDVGSIDRSLADFTIESVDGANAVLRLGKEERLVGQADLFNISKKIAKAIQTTY